MVHKEPSVIMTTVTKAAGRMFDREPLGFHVKVHRSGKRSLRGPWPPQERHHGAPSDPEFEGREWRSILVQTMAPKAHNGTGTVNGSHEEIVHRMAREIDLGKEADAVLATLHSIHGDELWEAWADIGRVLVDKTEAEAYDKSKMIPQREGIRAYGVMYRWFPDVSGLGLSEQAR
jgi:hypothetical protein